MIFMQSLQRNKQQSLKHRMFYLHHQILKHYNVSNIWYAIFLFMEMLQIMYYAVHSTYPDLWPLAATEIVQKAFHFAQISGIWQFVGDTALVTYLVIVLLIYLISIAFILYEVLKKDYRKKQPNMLAYKYITFIGILTKTVLFIPTVNACVSFFMVDSSHFPMTISPPIYAAMACLSVPTLLLLFVNTINFDIFLRENNPFSSLPFVSCVNQNEEIRTVIKLIMGFYGALVYGQSSIGKIFCFIFLIINIIYLSKIYSSPRILKFPYDLLIELAPCLTIWICISSLLQQYVYPSEQIGLLFFFCGIFITPFVWIQMKGRHRRQIMYSNYKFITSPEQLLYYNYQCLNCVNNLHKVRNLIYLEGVLNYHISQCKKTPDTCVCFETRQVMSNFKLQGQKVEINKEKKLWFKFIRNNLIGIKEKYRNTPQISMLLAYIERDQLNNKFKALHNLQQPNNFNNGLKIEFLNYHYLRQIQQGMSNQDRKSNEKKSVDVNKFIQFQNNFRELQNAIEDSTMAHLTFWSNLSSDRASRKKLIADGKAISQKVQQTKKLYQTLIQINPSNLHCLIIYTNYMKIIVNNPDIYDKSSEAIKIIKRNIFNSSKLNNDPQKQKYGDNAVTGVIIISGERSNIGIIKHCNTKINQLIKYSPHELLGQNINILMPKFIGSMHDDILMTYLELTESKYDNVERLAPMIDKDNYLIFIRMLTKPLPSLFNGLQLVGTFNLVTQSHIDHPGQIPKYVLYRTDSGQVQALSQSCDLQYNYRINKIDQNHQTSSQITFTSLFPGVKDSQLSQIDKAVKSKLKLTSQNGDLKQVSIEVYLRHYIFYFGVKLKLLYFFALKSSINMNYAERDPQNIGIYKQIIIQQEQAQGLKLNQKQKTTEIVKQKKIRQLMRKKNSQQYQPLSLKILSKFGYLAHLILIILIIVFLVSDLKSNQYLDDFLLMSITSLQSQSLIVQINYYSRIKQLSYNYPNQLSQFNLYSKNISTLSSQLQRKQFALVQHALATNSDRLTSKDTLISWTVNQNLQISSSYTTLDVNVFDYITGSSHFESSQQDKLNFSLKMLVSPVSTSQYIQLFHIRYTGLFQTIPSKLIYYQKLNLYFNNLSRDILNTGNLQLGLVCTCIFLMLSFCVPLLICIEGFISKTVMLFGYMNINQIENQINNCNVFLQIFFKDSYKVKLSQKKKNNDIIRFNSFGADDVKLSKLKQKSGAGTSFFSPFGIQKGTSSINSQFQILQSPRRGSVLKSAQKIQDLQKQFHQRTQHQIQVGVNQAQEQKQQMLVKANYQEDQSIYDKLQKSKDNAKYYYILIFFLLAVIFTSYFIARFLVNKISIQKNHEQIKNLKMVTESLNLMKKVKLYSVQAVLDNTRFRNYSLLSQITEKYVTQLYQHQRRYNTYIYSASASLAQLQGNDKISNMVKQSLCEQQNIKVYLSTVYISNLYPKSSYSQEECESIQDGILKQGFRPALTAFTQILYNFTRNPHTVNQMVKGDKFMSVVKMQKYLEGFQLFYIEKLGVNIHSKLQDFQRIQIIIFIVMVIVIICLVLLIWWPMMRIIYGKITSSFQILGLIPIRIFVKNQKLAKQYEKFITQMTD